MVIALVVVIIMLAVALTAIGAWIVIQGRPEEDSPPQGTIDRSGSYAILRQNIREELEKHKPSLSEIEEWLIQTYPQMPRGRAEAYVDKWQKDLEESIRVIEEGDRERISTFRIVLSPQDAERCSFLHADNFLTREQIQNHPHLIPPYYLGCDSHLVLKQPWDNPSKSGWKSVIPQQGGQYIVPDWRQLVE